MKYINISLVLFLISLCLLLVGLFFNEIKYDLINTGLIENY
ncbi:hypothetical protein [Virgibacillus salarius]